MANKLNMPKSLKLGGGRLPHPISGLVDWALAVDLIQIVQEVVLGDVQVTEKKIPFKGVVIPMKTEMIIRGRNLASQLRKIEPWAAVKCQ